MIKNAIIIGTLALAIVYSGCSDNATQNPSLTTTTPSYGCPLGEVYDSQSQQCGVDARTCPTGHILRGLTCEQKLVCPENQLFSSARNACLSKEYEITLQSAGVFLLNADLQGKVLVCPGFRNDDGFEFQLSSMELSADDLETFAGTMAGNYRVKIVQIFPAKTTEYTVLTTITASRSVATVTLVGQVDTTTLPAVPATPYHVPFDTSRLFPEDGTVVLGVPGRYKNTDRMPPQIGEYVVYTECPKE